jgi:internalin A
MDSTNYLPPFDIGPVRLSVIARIIGVGISTIVQKISFKGYKIQDNPNFKLNSRLLLLIAREFNCYKILGIDNYLFYYKKLEMISLDISGLDLTSIPQGVTEITNLIKIDLSHNRISDYRFLEKLDSLRILYLSSNQISDISFLEKTKNINSLDLSHNQISDISLLEKMKKIQSLDLSHNQISDISFLEKTKNILSLNLCFNQISDISPIVHLIQKGLQISNLNLQEFNFKNKINLYGNLTTNPPLEIVKQGREAVIEYFESKRKPLNECKLIFVGDGRVGKTSLMRRVVYNTFDKKETTTHGINKIAWEEIRTSNNEKIRVNLWDFGGQHIQHSLHQFFFTKRVIYVLVLNPRNDLKANYWLDQIDKLGCDSEVLIVYNWKQTEDKQADFMGNFYELRKKYPKLPEPFILSCETGEGIESFKEQLIVSILRNESLKDEYVDKWFNIKQRLEKEISVGKNYINYDTYQAWCREEDYDKPERQRDLLEILNRIGSIVFFDKPKLEDWQVLNPEWITTGAYSILVSEQNKTTKGHLSWQDLKAIFKEEKEVFSDKAIKIKYTENQFQFIIDLMLEYDLCQRNPFHQHEYLIPSAFGERPDKNYDFAKDDARVYRLDFESPFEMLVIHRFIAKNLTKITGKDYWQSGIYIKHPTSETYALVETNLYSKRIDCWIKGDNIRGFWEIIRVDFREILSIYHNFEYNEEVEYLKDGKSYFLSYQEMLNALADGIRTIEYDKETRLKNIDVLSVLDLFEDVNQTYTKMDNERGITINTGGGDFINNGQFGGKNNTQINNAKAEMFEEIKELLLDLEEYNVQNEEWKKVLIKALDEFHKLESATEESSQKTSISILDRTFKKLKELKDVVSIGFLTVDIEKKLPTLLAQWDTLKTYFH